MDDVVGKNGKPYKNQRKAKTDRAVARWREMIESGRIDWSQINPNYYKLRKDYARTDTPFHVVESNINFEQASDQYAGLNRKRGREMVMNWFG